MSLYSRRQVRCTICTPYRWQGNGKNRFKSNQKPDDTSEQLEEYLSEKNEPYQDDFDEEAYELAIIQRMEYLLAKLENE